MKLVAWLAFCPSPLLSLLLLNSLLFDGGAAHAASLNVADGLGEAEERASANVVKLDDGAADRLQSGEWLILFFADWCGACQVYKPHFYQVAQWAAEHRQDLQLAMINHADAPLLLTRFFVTQLPTLYHIKGGEYRRIPFQGIDLPRMLSEGSWTKFPPTRPWLKPFALLPSAIALVGGLGARLVIVMTRFQAYTGLNLVFTLALVAMGVISLFAGLSLLEGYLLARRAALQKKAHPKHE